jgi:hypothetical protein
VFGLLDLARILVLPPTDPADREEAHNFEYSNHCRAQASANDSTTPKTR